MSAATLYESGWHESSRHEPHQWPAGIMALAVHGVLFALLYFGFSWHAKPIEMINVELWQSLPETVEAPPEQPMVEEVVQPPAQPVEIAKPDIELPDDKKSVPSPVEAIEPKRAEKKPVKKPAAAKANGKKSVAQKQVDMDLDQDLLLAEQQAEQQAERERAEQAAAKGRVLKEYGDKIKSKIKYHIVMPPGVPDSAQAVFRVTLLPGGAVLSAVMKKSSGSAAYDNAVERAILKSDPLPLPPDAGMFKDFRILELKFQPKE